MVLDKSQKVDKDVKICQSNIYLDHQMLVPSSTISTIIFFTFPNNMHLFLLPSPSQLSRSNLLRWVPLVHCIWCINFHCNRSSNWFNQYRSIFLEKGNRRMQKVFLYWNSEPAMLMTSRKVYLLLLNEICLFLFYQPFLILVNHRLELLF